MNKEINLLMLTSLGAHYLTATETSFTSSLYRASVVDGEDEYKFEGDDEEYDDDDDEDEDDDYDDEDYDDDEDDEDEEDEEEDD